MSQSTHTVLPTPETPAAPHTRGVNPLKALQRFGQSVWLDYLRHSLFTSGEFSRLIDEDGLRGVTSNPSIFEKAIAGGTDYLNALQEIELRGDVTPVALYEALAIRDIRDAADLLRPIYDSERAADGYVSLEVSPYLAHDTAGTIEEARRLWQAVDRPNLMIKVPASKEGLPAIRQLTAEGINVNITLLFGLDRYEDVARAYFDGLADYIQRGGDPARVSSVASIFVSRIDTMVDQRIAARLVAETDPATRTLLEGLLGRVAIANARLAYQRYLALCRTRTWRDLAARGAHRQRLLWASTSTKNPRYGDVRYVEELIGPETVNTMTPATLDAFRNHGRPRHSLDERPDDARRTIEDLARAGISLLDVTDQLLEDGIAQFTMAFDTLLATVARGRRSEIQSMLDRQSCTLSAEQTREVAAVLADWQAGGKPRRLWARDATLWTDADEGQWLGWLGVTDDQVADMRPLRDLAHEVANSGVLHVVLLGMGGSSLGADVFRSTFGHLKGFPELHVLDSTDPAQISAVEDALDLRRTLFVVSSKSGATLEPDILLRYFMDRMRMVAGAQLAAGHFMAITDPGSPLEGIAVREHFRQIFPGVRTIGGRYSVLSNVGLVPAALMGVDIARLLDSAELMVHSCAASVPANENPAVRLGATLATLARAGRDKVTLVTSPAIESLGAWLEQLIAESTGKRGRGLIPIDREPLGSPDVYGADRVFVYTRLQSEPDASQDAAIDALERAGHPIVRLGVADIHDIGQEFFRWQMAIAVAGSVLGINPFDQPDVEASKIRARAVTTEFEKTGALPSHTPLFAESGIEIFTDAGNAEALERGLQGDRSLAGYLRAHLRRLQEGDYFAMLAFLAMDEPHMKAMQAMRRAVRDRTRRATCVGFGPRFLHSTGQAYKGGPNSGVFLQITCDDARDIHVPGTAYSFGVVKAAQAYGDFQVLTEGGRRALGVHLGTDTHAGVTTLTAALIRALEE